MQTHTALVIPLPQKATLELKVEAGILLSPLALSVSSLVSLVAFKGHQNIAHRSCPQQVQLISSYYNIYRLASYYLIHYESES